MDTLRRIHESVWSLLTVDKNQLTKLIRLRWAADVIDRSKEEDLHADRDEACRYRCKDLHCPSPHQQLLLDGRRDNHRYQKM
jgi:hypothetical protein